MSAEELGRIVQAGHSADRGLVPRALPVRPAVRSSLNDLCVVKRRPLHPHLLRQYSYLSIIRLSVYLSVCLTGFPISAELV